MKLIKTKIAVAVATIVITPIGIMAECYGDGEGVPWDQVLESVGQHIFVTCGYNNTPCLMYPQSSCKDVSSYDPAPPNFIIACTQSNEPTGMRCDYEERTVTQHYYSGVPFCTDQPTPCNSGCKDWDTEISEESTKYRAGFLEDCPASA